MEFIHADLADPLALAAAVSGVEVVCHQAAKVGLGVDFADAPDYVRSNDLATAVLLAAMTGAGVRRLVLASSMVVYGEGRYRDALGAVAAPPRAEADLEAGRFEPVSPRTGEPLEPLAISEEDPVDPRNVYAASKLMQEHLCAVWARETGGSVAALRYHNVYGPGMPQATPYAGVAAIFRSSLEAGAAPQVFEDGGQRRDFVHVADVAAANLAALQWTATAAPRHVSAVQRRQRRGAHRRRDGARARGGLRRTRAAGDRPVPPRRRAAHHRVLSAHRGRARLAGDGELRRRDAAVRRRPAATTRRAAAMSAPRRTRPLDRERAVGRAAAIGLTVCVVLIVAALVIPRLTAWDVQVRWFPPLHAEWMPRLGPGTPAVLALAVLAVVFAPRMQNLPWRRLLLVVYALGLAWMLSLATVDGLDGIGVILDTQYEYLRTARAVTDFGETLRIYVDRIPLDSEDNWPVHIAGHPPGALLFFVVLVRLGLGSGLAAGLVVTVDRRLHRRRRAADRPPPGRGEPRPARRAVPHDRTRRDLDVGLGRCRLRRVRRVGDAGPGDRRDVGGSRPPGGWGILAGALLGYCVMLSYGLPLLGVLAVTILVLARSWRPLPWAVGAALVVVGLFALGGFAWWEAFPVLQQRYWDGVASRRPAAYWMWANLAAVSISAGPWVGAAVGAAIATGLGRARPNRHVAADAAARARPRSLPGWPSRGLRCACSRTSPR